MSNENTEDKYCCDCKYLVGRRTYDDLAASWRCHAAANVSSIDRDLVTGQNIYVLRFKTCYDARNTLTGGCGKDGVWYERYARVDAQSDPFPRPKVVGGQRYTADQLLAELEGSTEERKGD